MIYLTHYRSKDIMRNLWWKYVATLVSENNILRNSDADYETVDHKKQKKALALVSAPCFFASGMQSCLHYRQQSRTDQK